LSDRIFHFSANTEEKKEKEKKKISKKSIRRKRKQEKRRTLFDGEGALEENEVVDDGGIEIELEAEAFECVEGNGCLDELGGEGNTHVAGALVDHRSVDAWKRLEKRPLAANVIVVHENGK
jgi:hypothetical protein